MIDRRTCITLLPRSGEVLGAIGSVRPGLLFSYRQPPMPRWPTGTLEGGHLHAANRVS